MMLAGQLALVTAALFTGAAIYINIAEHPARMGLQDGALLTQWKPSYKRGFAMQSSLAIAGFLLGLFQYYLTPDWRWALAALVLITNWPFTLAAIMPVNNQLMAMPLNAPNQEMRGLMARWGKLHAVRSGLGALATLLFLWAMP